MKISELRNIIKGSVKEILEKVDHSGKTCDEAHPDMSHPEWEKTQTKENFDDRLRSVMGDEDFEKATNPQLARLIKNAIGTIDTSMSYRDFAKGVAQVLIDDYGVHKYEPFIKELKNTLDSTLGQ